MATTSCCNLQGVRTVVAKERPLTVQVARDGRRWSGQVCIPHSDLPPGELMVNGYAILGPPGERHYSVVTTLGGDEPDFHRIHEFLS